MKTMIVSDQLDMFKQQEKERYQAYYQKFYARNLQEAEASRRKAKEPKPIECISIVTGEVLTIQEMIEKYHILPKIH